MKENTKKNIVVTAIIIIAIIIRMIFMMYSNLDVNVDEAMSAINAKSISEDGKDMYGTTFPVYLEAWRYGGQSVALPYLMAIAIKILGASLLAVRLPLFIISIISLYVAYDLSRKIFKNSKIVIIVLVFLAINPWHIVQSIWGLDCNIFPHIILIAVDLLYTGIIKNKKKYLYISMIFFAISMYSYGLALYFVPVFLIIFSIYLNRKKLINKKDTIMCILIYTTLSLPIYIMTFINFFKMNDIHIGPITIQYFKEFRRTNAMLLFSENKLQMLIKNIITLISVIIFQTDGLVWNAIPFWGTQYIVSIPFLIEGIIVLLKKHKTIYKDEEGRTIISIWLIGSLLIGIFMNGININRLNIIWYPIIIITATGIYSLFEKTKKHWKILVIVLYIILLIGFLSRFLEKYAERISKSVVFAGGIVEAIQYTDQLDKEQVIIMDKKENERTEIFLKYAINFENDNQDSDRYQIISDESQLIMKENNVYILHNNIKSNISIEGYEEKTFGKYTVLYK